MPEYEEFMNILKDAGINTEIGLECCADMEDIYVDVVNTYHEEDNTKDLEDALQKKDLSLYGTYAHGVKSASKSIGAMDFAELAYSMELAGKEGNLEMIEKNHAHFLEEYKKVQDVLDKALQTVEL